MRTPTFTDNLAELTAPSQEDMWDKSRPTGRKVLEAAVNHAQQGLSSLWRVSQNPKINPSLQFNQIALASDEASALQTKLDNIELIQLPEPGAPG